MGIELLFEQATAFRGSYPDIPLPSDVDVEALGEQAFFVTLPVGRVNAKSRGSGRVYTENAVKSLVRQINEKRPEGRYGHLAMSELATRYDPPAIRWLAAELVDGVAWAKGLPLTEQAREHFRVAKATNARVGTSVFGPPPVSEGNRVIDLELYSIDIADPARVGIPETAAHPSLTSEMENSQMDETKDLLLSEMKTQRDEAILKAGAAESERDQAVQKAAELQAQLDAIQKARAYVSEMADSYISMGININASGPDLEQVIREMTAKLMALQSGELVAKINGTVSEMVQLEDLRPFVTEMLVDADGQPRVKDVDEAKAKIAAYLERDNVKALAQKLLSEQAGPSVFSSPANTGSGHGESWRDDIAAKAAALAAERGVR